jgi:hypothetical protein
MRTLDGGFFVLLGSAETHDAQVISLKGAQIPSIADEVATDLRTLRWRKTGSLR